jgi:serine protease AprX
MKTSSKAFPVSSTAIEPTTGVSYTDYYDVFTIGAGYIDIAAALSNYEETLASSVSPSATYNPVSQKGYLVLPLLSNWRWSPEWSVTAVWGNVTIPNGGTIWNSSDVWSSSSDWGTSIVWGTGSDSSTSIVWGTSGEGEE